MAAKWSIASDTTAADRLLFVGQDALHLSTGDLVQLVEDPATANPGKISLVVVPGPAHTTPSTIAVLNASTAAGATFLINHALPQCLALCRDASDNLYVIGAYGGSTPRLLVFQAFIKQAGLVWQPGVANTCSTAVSANIAPVGYVALWCNTGGGTRYPALTGSPAGHIIVAATTNDGTVTNACYILDAGKVLAGTAHAGSVTTNPAFLGDSSTLYGSNLDLSANGFGATQVMAISASGTAAAQIAGCGVSSTGLLTTGDGTLLTVPTGTLSATTKLRIAINPESPGAWVVGFPSATNAGQISTGVVAGTTLSPLTDSGTASNFPAPSATLAWDLAVDPENNVWIYGWSLQASHRDDMLRVPINFNTFPGTLGAVVTDETAVGGTGTISDNTTIRTVKEPVDWFHADWQAYDVTTPFSLQGDFSVLPVTPNVPTLVSPVNNAAAPLAAGGTFVWDFTSPVPGDSQDTYYLRFQTAAGYQWWTGSALTAAQAGATGGSEVAVTADPSQATLGAGILSTGAWSWSVQVTGESGVVSGYSPAWIVNVAAQPATPTLTASYDSVNNRATLAVAGTGTDDAWFQYSDASQNLLTAEDASLEGGTVGSWGNFNAVAVSNAPLGLDGTHSLEITGTSSNLYAISAAYPVVPGDTYTVLASFRAAATPRSVAVAVWWFDATLASISISPEGTATDTTTGWVQANITLVAPAGAVWAKVLLHIPSGVLSEVHYADEIGLFPGSISIWAPGNPGGGPWFNVRGATAIAQVSGAATVYDWEVPANATRSYRVLQWDPASSVLGNLSNWSTIQTATSAITKFWLRDPLAQSIGINPHVQAGTLKTSFGRQITEHNPLGRKDTVLVKDVVGLEDGGCTFFSVSVSDDAALMALLLSTDTLRFTTTDSRSWFVSLNAPVPIDTPYLVAPNAFRAYAVTWRGQQRPPA